jgi:hypothetical protein
LVLPLEPNGIPATAAATLFFCSFDFSNTYLTWKINIIYLFRHVQTSTESCLGRKKKKNFKIDLGLEPYVSIEILLFDVDCHAEMRHGQW